MNSKLFLIFTLLSTLKLSLCHEKPIIGILTQEIYWSDLRNAFQPLNSTYIASSYVKSIEASGGQVIPVFTNRTTRYYMEVIIKVNGILIPGGDCSFDTSFGICHSANEIFHIAKYLNIIGDYFPILGVCLGFELLLVSSYSGKNPLSGCSSHDINVPLELIPGMEKKSVLFKNMPKDIQKILLTQPVTANHHEMCMTRKDLKSTHLDNFWNPITVNNDKNNLTFISTIEAKNYPFVGLQFHPEKNAYEWVRKDPHSWPAIYSARYFYDWFVNECRKNKHRFINKNKLKKELIYNYPVTYIGNGKNPMFEQVYIFNT